MSAATSDAKISAMRQDRANGLTLDEISKKHGISVRVVIKYTSDSGSEPNLPEVSEEAFHFELPEVYAQEYKPFIVDEPGHWLVINDTHIPVHDINTLNKAIEDGKRTGVTGILFNGDTIDATHLSMFEKDLEAPTIIEEIDRARQLLTYTRWKFPKARIVYKEGNHDERFDRFIRRNCRELYKMRGLNLQTQLTGKLEPGDKDLNVEWVRDKRVIKLGKLPVLHGHEYKGGGGVNPARWLYLRTGWSAMCGHFHRTAEHTEPIPLADKIHATWTVGCSCTLTPAWCPLNHWNNGYAKVEIFRDRNFHVTNRKILPNGDVA